MIGAYGPVRPLDPTADAERVARMFDRLSDDTVFRRFFTLAPKGDRRLLDALLSVDHDQHEALVMQVGTEIVAMASYHRHPDDPAVADVAVLVEDGWQHHGLGRRLMRQLTRLARQRGVDSFHADVLADNRKAMGLIRRMGSTAKPRFESGELVYDMPLVPAA